MILDEATLDKEMQTVKDARQRVSRWMEDAPSFLEMVARVVDDRQRALTIAEAAERECERLRSDLGRARADLDGLKRERTETAEALAEALGRAAEALARFRGPSSALSAPAAPPVPVPAAVPMAPAPVAMPVAPAVEDHVRAPEAPTAVAAGTPPIRTPEPEHGVAPAVPVVGAPRVDTAVAKRILLVDDDQNFRNVIVEYLAGFRGYDVQVAVNGEEALARLEDDRPDMVLLDLMMPGIGGMGTLQRMKTQYPDLPVVMVTANEDLSLARKALGLGASDYVTKPFDLDYLDAVLNLYLSNREPQDQPEPTLLTAVGGIASAARSLKGYFSRR